MQHMTRTSLEDLYLINGPFNYTGPGRIFNLSSTDFSRRNDIPVLYGDNLHLCESAGWQITQDIDVIRKRMLHGN